MYFVPLGVGDAFAARHYSSSIAICAGDPTNEWLLVDCPHPIRKMMREAGVAAGVPIDVGQFTAVALTHLHADHSSGLEGFAYFGYFETNFGVHTPYADLAALPEPLRKKMRLIHYWDDFDLAASVIEPLVEGRRYDV